MPQALADLQLSDNARRAEFFDLVLWVMRNRARSLAHCTEPPRCLALLLHPDGAIAERAAATFSEQFQFLVRTEKQFAEGQSRTKEHPILSRIYWPKQKLVRYMFLLLEAFARECKGFDCLRRYMCVRGAVCCSIGLRLAMLSLANRPLQSWGVRALRLNPFLPRGWPSAGREGVGATSPEQHGRRKAHRGHAPAYQGL